jgi:hypothetical protein
MPSRSSEEQNDGQRHPLISFQRVLDPLIIMGTLYLSSLLFRETFTGYSLVLMILAFFISSAVYQHIDPYRTWRSGRMLAYARDTLFGWAITIAVLLFLGSASGLSYYYDERVVGAWFVATPLALLASHIAVRRASGGPERNSEVRSVIVVGANDVGIKFAAICEKHSNLFMQMHGFFDDRADPRHPAGLRHPMLGKMSEIAAYVRGNNIKMIFISQPISAQLRIRQAARRIAGHHGLGLLPARHLHLRPDAGALRQRRRHAGDRHLRNPVHGPQQRHQARQRHRVRLRHPGAAGAADAGHRAGGQADLARPGDLPAAPLRPVRRGNHRLQVPLDDGHR